MNASKIQQWCLGNERYKGWLGHFAEATKCASYAYPTSDLATWFGHHSTGCYVLRTGLTAQAFTTLDALKAADKASPLPTGIYCMIRDFQEQEKRQELAKCGAL